MSKLVKQLIVIGAVVSVLVSCGSNEKTIGDLKYKPEKEKKLEFKKLNHAEVRKEYQELLDLFEDKTLKEQIERRIADVYMVEGGREQLKPNTNRRSYYLDAIKNYRKILDKYPNSPDNADVYYQLARAYDMEGNQKEAMKMLIQLTRRYPNYKFIAEAHFRKGDIFYNNKKYAQAQQEYFRVTTLKNEKFRVYSHYMLAWSYYKQFQFEASLDAFAYVLNDSMQNKNKNKNKTDKTKRNLISDTLHSMSLALSRVGGASAIERIKRLQNKDYIWMVYENLGDYFLTKERYEDSASTYRMYVQRYNYTKKAPDLHSKLINTYIKGKFPKQALEEKETYVQYYGLNSEYARNMGGIIPNVKKQLRIYIEELARYYHNQGQQYQKEIAAKHKKLSPDKKRQYDKNAITAYESAATFYQKFIDTFPQDALVGEMTFLKAEVLYSARLYTKAVVAYETVAYITKSKSAAKYKANAGYAAIISYQKHLDTLEKDSEQSKLWQSRAVESMLRFASTFYNDKRSASVLTNAAEYLFGLNQYERALKVTTDLINKNPKLDKTLKKTAYGIMAHSQFNLGNYQGAEDSYLNQRQLTAVKSKEYNQISERLANAIFKKSEGLVAKKDQVNAVAQLLKIKRLAPNSPVRVIAQYDAATMLLGMKKWNQAISELKELLAKYPKHKLAVEFPRKLAFAYEKSQRYKLAADAYFELVSKDPDPEIRRDALFLAADLYKKNKNYDTAIKLFKRYARTYEQPFDNRMEARYQLAVLYEKVKDFNRQLFWLRRIIDGDRKGGNQRTERSRWLGAWANIKYGDYFAGEFKRLRLRQPLVKYLPKKNEALKGASDRYQQAADYGILEFVTMSSYKLAELYDLFAKQLRKAPKPRGLSADERVAYKEIIEEQAQPFQDLAIELHQGNIERAWNGEYDEWIDKSFKKMKVANPARYNKEERLVSYGDEIF